MCGDDDDGGAVCCGDDEGGTVCVDDEGGAVCVVMMKVAQ